MCNSRFSKPSVVLWWDGFGRFGIKTATICTIPRAARSEDWVKVVSGGRWNILKRGNHLNIYIYLSKGDEHERVLFAVPSTLQNSPFETQKATLHIHFELLSLPLSILTVLHCASPWTICSDSIVQKSKKFLSSCWGPFNSYSIHSLKRSILLTTSNAIIVLSSFRFILFDEYWYHKTWWSVAICKTFSGQISIIQNKNKRKVQGPTQSSKTSHRILCSTELCTLRMLCTVRMWPLKISFSERILWDLHL